MRHTMFYGVSEIIRKIFMFVTTQNKFYKDYNGNYCCLYNESGHIIATINIEDNLLTITKVKSDNSIEIDISGCDDADDAFESLLEEFENHNLEIDEEECWELTMRSFNEDD